MKKGIIIGGLVLVIGGVSYFLYMKEKKKEQGLIAENQPTDENAEAKTGVPSGATSGVPSGAPINKEIPPLSTSAVVSPSVTFMSIEEQNKLDKARDLFEKIKTLIPLDSRAQKKEDENKKLPIQSRKLLVYNSYRPQINKLRDELLQLGYEIKGTSSPVLVKLNAL